MRLVLLLVLAAVAAVALAAASRPPAAPSVRLGAPADTAALLAGLTLEEVGRAGEDLSPSLETMTVGDCCATVAQWALSADELDLALMCPDAAATLLAKDPDYVNLGPCLVGSEILVVRPDTHGGAVAVAANRQRQADMVRDMLGPEAEPVPMLRGAVPLAFAKGVVAGAVMDFFSALKVEGRTITPAAPRVSCVLVARKDFLARPEAADYLAAIDRAARRLAEPEELRRAAARYLRATLNDNEMALWKKMRVRFVSPTSTPTGS